MAAETLPSSRRYLRRALGTVVALLCRRHFFTLQRRSRFRSPLMRICVEPSFFRNFFSTYLALIHASFSCLKQREDVIGYFSFMFCFFTPSLSKHTAVSDASNVSEFPRAVQNRLYKGEEKHCYSPATLMLCPVKTMILFIFCGW